MVRLILTLTINPAIDRTFITDRLVFEDRTYILESSESAGGRGINASRVIHSFGGPTLALATAGGAAGERFREHLRGAGFPFELVPIASEIRTNLAITDLQGLTVKLNEVGPQLRAEEVEQVEAAVQRHLPGAEWLMLCGSIPPGVPPDFYARLISAARAQGVKTLLDTDGEALRQGIKARPSVVTPNQQEAERLLNLPILTRAGAVAAAAKICEMGAELVVLSLGSRGAVTTSRAATLEVIPPPVEAVCPIGAGDALAAAFVWAMVNHYSEPDALRWAVAAGTASARLPGIRFASLADTREIFERVEVRPASA